METTPWQEDFMQAVQGCSGYLLEFTLQSWELASQPLHAARLSVQSPLRNGEIQSSFIGWLWPWNWLGMRRLTFEIHTFSQS